MTIWGNVRQGQQAQRFEQNQQGRLTEGEGSVQLTPLLSYLVLLKRLKKALLMQSSSTELIGARRSTVLSYPSVSTPCRQALSYLALSKRIFVRDPGANAQILLRYSYEFLRKKCLSYKSATQKDSVVRLVFTKLLMAILKGEVSYLNK